MIPKTKKRKKRGIKAKKLLDLWALCVKTRDGYTCQYCHKNYTNNTRGVNAHHIWTKGGHPIVKFSLRNGITLCVYCHRMEAHGRSQLFNEWVKKKLGKKTHDLLYIRANQHGKNDLTLVELELNYELKELRNAGL
ncbi:hypothetical protein MNBD_GAMMA01-1322 [hydrothermal vent metagenome]|uniref:HNH nuclease domain-containing protein n=1 Tax=hydrothermal vent metagenome TaxID=652676 RepID=A0A3B0VIU4_9ZZZZ